MLCVLLLVPLLSALPLPIPDDEPMMCVSGREFIDMYYKMNHHKGVIIHESFRTRIQELCFTHEAFHHMIVHMCRPGSNSEECDDDREDLPRTIPVSQQIIEEATKKREAGSEQ